jgi:hypothetical protein
LRREGQIYPIHRIALKRDENSRERKLLPSQKGRKKNHVCLPTGLMITFNINDRFRRKTTVSYLFSFPKKTEQIHKFPGAENIL